MALQDKKALITGASAGIGAEFAKQLHAKGCKLVLVARREELLRQISEELNNIRSDSVEYRAIDLTDRSEAGLKSLLSYIENIEIDILVNNAGRGSFGHFNVLDREVEEEIVHLNVIAPLLLAHKVIPQMKKRRAGDIVTISSIAGFQPLPYMASYAASKAFNYSHSLGLRYELKQFGINVLTVCPGPTNTEFAGVARVPGHCYRSSA